jgi:hypothetical protein
MEGHDLSMNFARRNRFMIANRILGQIASRKKGESNVESEMDGTYAIDGSSCLIDIHHNFVENATI